MPTNFGEFTESDEILDNYRLVGYSSASVGGERKWRFDTLKRALSASQLNSLNLSSYDTIAGVDLKFSSFKTDYNLLSSAGQTLLLDLANTQATIETNYNQLSSFELLRFSALSASNQVLFRQLSSTEQTNFSRLSATSVYIQNALSSTNTIVTTNFATISSRLGKKWTDHKSLFGDLTATFVGPISSSSFFPELTSLFLRNFEYVSVTPPSNTTTPVNWVDVYVGTVLYKMPLYQ